MPKKENRPSLDDLKKKQEKKITEKKERELGELGDLFKKSAEKSKTQRHEGNEESGESELEEDVDDQSLSLQSPEFHQFMHLSGEQESRAPVLERIAGSAPRPVFVGSSRGSSATISNGNSSEDEFKYTSGTGNANEPKYFSEPGITSPEKIDFNQVGRERIVGFREEVNQERFFMQSEPKIEQSSPERFERPERFDFEREGRKNQLETEHQKYRPRLPKS
ncbi:MAG: hypothetical protein AABW93_00265 [Nanoarchaeota archaeon]